MSRVRQFGQVRDSRRSDKSSLSAQRQQRLESAKRNLICVNCINKSLSKQKQMKCQIEKQQQLSASKLQVKQKILQPVSRNKKIDENHKQINQYNTEVAKVHSAQKEMLKIKKLKQKVQIENLREKLLKERENIVKKEKTQKQKWFNDLKGQLAEKEQKKEKQKIQKLQKSYLQQENIFHSLTRNMQRERNERYKTELQQQIKINQKKKEVQKQQELKMNQRYNNYLLELAQQRQSKLLKQQIEKKRLLWQEGIQKQNKIVTQRHQKQILNQKTKQQIANRENQQLQRIQLIAKMKENQMNEYIKQVKQQISQREAMKRRQKQAKIIKIQQKFQINLNKNKQTLGCNSCQKQYPINYLSDFQTNL